MQWLTALLAFATTMLIFAIIVSSFVEMLHRLMKLRSQGMRLMLESLYERVIKDRLSDPDKPSAQQFATLIMENRAVSGAPGQKAPGRIRSFLHWLVDSSVMTDIPVEVFTQKLADNRIVGTADDMTDNVLTDIAQKYVAFGNEAGAYFERRARVFSIIIALIVAWAFYVHPYNLALTYFKNPEIAQSVADKAAEAHSDYRALVERLNSATSGAQVSAADAEALRTAIEDLKTEIEGAKNQTAALANLGVPVGWPSQDGLGNCTGLMSMSDCRLSIFGSVWTRPSFGTIFWLLIGGLLVGLGAPFWAQAVSSLTASRDVTRKITDVVNPERSTGGGFGTKGMGIGPGTTSTSLATFTLARRAQGQTELAKAKAAAANPGSGGPKGP